MSLLIRQVTVIDPQSEFHNQVVDIAIEQNGQISTISSSIAADKQEVIDVSGVCISRGFVDIFADYRDPGLEHKETITSGLKAAATGGFTDVFLLPNTNPPTCTKASVEYLLQRAKGSIVNIHPIGALTQQIDGKALAEMLDMHTHGAIAFSDGWKPLQNAGLMLKALEYVRAFNGMVIQMPIDVTLALGGLMHEGETSTRLGMAGIPKLAESIQLYRDIELLRYTQSRIHFTGISTEESVEMIRQAKKDGMNITCSVTPYHLAFTDESLVDYDSVFKVSPVLRSEKDRQALISGLKDGTIDCIASHHRPQDWDAKTKEFEYSGDGMNLQEITFQVVYDTLEKQVPLARIIEALSIRPREIFGLLNSPIAVGTNCYTLISTQTNSVVSDNTIRSLSRNNPYIGKSIRGSILGLANNGMLHLYRP
ncbi:MAG: dihydroorotase [Bacteroidetes bacterium]|nr:dihydroorotase [Bacteroidota bacterium]MBS1739611.1 dihydroorotase [Bacteroidota bacterium]MBS1777489.1 dihydroorotase [Bacteroidota bacterium]